MPVKRKASPKVPKVVSVAVVVSNRDKARTWYTEKLGLQVVSDMDHWVCVGQKGQGGMIHLCQVDESGEDPPVLEPGNSGVLLTVPDLARFYAELKGRGVTTATEPKTESWGSYMTVTDPDGNRLSVMPSFD